MEAENNTGDWESVEQVFLVCVYNVAPDQPYTIFKAPTSSNAQDIITQVLNNNDFMCALFFARIL